MVTICPYCRSVVARGDRNVEDLGVVAALVDTDSLLEVGLQGKYQGHTFTVTGRTQLRHAAGGLWDEWYASFPNDQWGWIAEAQGKLYLTFQQKMTGAAPAYDSLHLGQNLPLFKGATFVVAEKAEASIISGEGEIPFRLAPGDTARYVDLAGPNNMFATLDYSDDQPALYYGKEVTLAELDLPEKVQPAYREEKRIAGHALACPNCGGALELRAPDQAERVTCPNCRSLLDINQGQLIYLQALAPTELTPLIPLGTTGTVPDGEMTVIGLVERCVHYAGIDYYWTEYLLYRKEVGFRWLVNSEDHWSYVKPISPADISGYGRKVWYNGEKFKLFQKADAMVSYVLGEFYWKVQIGETVNAADYINPPEMLSREMTAYALPQDDGDQDLASMVASAVVAEGEMNWSHGTYMPAADVAKAFNLPSLPRSRGIAPNQPFRQGQIYMTWGLMICAVALIGMAQIFTAPRTEVLHVKVPVKLADTTPQPIGVPDKPADASDKISYTPVFELESRKNIQIHVTATMNNCWLGVSGDLVNQDTQEVTPFFMTMEHWTGIDDGEAWSEGNNEGSVLLSSVPAGKYKMRLEFVKEQGPGMTASLPTQVDVELDQGVPRWGMMFKWMFWISVLPSLVGLYHLWFSYRRWQASDYSPFGSSE